MKITKGEKIDKNHLKNHYKVHMDFMIGDADGYDHVDVLINEDNPFLERFLEFVKACFGLLDFGKVKDSDIFIDEDGFGEMDAENGGLFFDWPYDCRWDQHCKFSRYVITYFDENGDEFEVLINNEKSPRGL